MSDGQVSLGAAGELRLVGTLDYLSGPALRKQGGEVVARSTADPLIIDCSGVDKSSSVGLSLVLAFMRDAQSRGRSVLVRGLPDDMLGIARVCGLDRVLPIA